MAFVNFYLSPSATGANNLNSGSTLAAPTHTYGGGTFVRATNTFTVASGNPSTDGFVSAGDYVSVYTTSGRTVATFVMKVDSTTSTTIVGSASGIVYGVNTTVSETANASSLTIGGAWVSELPLAATTTAGGLGTFTVPQSTKFNITGNLTIVASRTIAMAGATTTPLWFSGYNTNPGDLDNNTTDSLSPPVWTLNSTFTLTWSGVFQTWSSLSVSGSRTGTVLTVSASPFEAVRCRSENTSSDVAAVALTVSTQRARFGYCYFKVPTTATTTGVVSGSTRNIFRGCVFDSGGVAGLNYAATTDSITSQCVFINCVGSGILFSTGGGQILNCTFYYGSTDGVKWTGTPSTVTPSSVIGCLFSGLNGSTAMTNGINASAGVTDDVFRACNDYYNVTNPEVNMGDSFAFFPQTDSNPVATSGTNMTPVAGSNARNNGFPGIFENQTYSSYPAIGAVTPIGGGYVPQVFE